MTNATDVPMTATRPFKMLYREFAEAKKVQAPSSDWNAVMRYAGALMMYLECTGHDAKIVTDKLEELYLAFNAE